MLKILALVLFPTVALSGESYSQECWIGNFVCVTKYSGAFGPEDSERYVEQSEEAIAAVMGDNPGVERIIYYPDQGYVVIVGPVRGRVGQVFRAKRLNVTSVQEYSSGGWFLRVARKVDTGNIAGATRAKELTLPKSIPSNPR